MLYLEFREQFFPQVIHKFSTIIRVQLIWQSIDVEMLIHQHLGDGTHFLVWDWLGETVSTKTILCREQVSIPSHCTVIPPHQIFLPRKYFFFNKEF